MKGSYLHHKEVRAAQGIKIAAQNLENAVAGTQLLVAGKDDSLEELREEVMQDIEDIFSSVDRSGARAASAAPGSHACMRCREGRLRDTAAAAVAACSAPVVRADALVRIGCWHPRVCECLQGQPVT